MSQSPSDQGSVTVTLSRDTAWMLYAIAGGNHQALERAEAEAMCGLPNTAKWGEAAESLRLALDEEQANG